MSDVNASKSRGSIVRDAEMAVLGKVWRILAGLDGAARRRVVQYLNDRAFCEAVNPVPKEGACEGGNASPTLFDGKDAGE